MHAHEETVKVQDPGPAVFPPRFRGLLLGAAVIGAAVFALALAVDPQRAWYSFLANYFYFLVLGVGGVFLIALENITSATWTVVFRRIPEAVSTYLPAGLVLGIVLLIGVPHLYPWASPNFHFLTHSKTFYFSRGFYNSRTIVALLLWTGFGAWFVRNSLAQDTNPGSIAPRATFGKRPTIRGRMGALFLIVFGYSFTIVFVDWIMSLEPRWSTTMWGVYGFAGLFQSSLALVLLVTVLMRRRHMFGGAVRDHHYVDLARMLHAFSIFMVYIGFAQYLLIWYANFRDESIYFHQRIVGGWGWIFVLLLFAKWVVPFVILLNQKVRTNEKVLIAMASLILAAEWFDIYWLIMPSIHPTFNFPSWVELGMFLGFFGVFGLLVTRYLSKHPTIPIGDPKLLNSVAGRYL